VSRTERPLGARRAFAAPLSAAAVVGALASGCGDDFDPGSRLVGTRVLAVQADRPYAPPGDTVTLRALAIDTLGRPLEWAFATCVDPTSATPAACFQKLAADAPRSATPPFTVGAAGTASGTIPADALSRLPPEGRGSAYVGAVLVTCPGHIDFARSTGAIPLGCVDASGRALGLDEFEIGVKRVFVRERDRNANPEIASVTWDGAPWAEEDVKDVAPCGSTTENRYDRCDGDKHTLAAHVTEASFEQGTDELGAAFSEQLVIQHYDTEGIFEYDARVARSPETGWVARAGASGKTVTIYFVARDNRGGVSWAIRQVRVR
jgi:hypothetical protein